VNKFTRIFLIVLPIVLTVAPSVGLLGTVARIAAGAIALILTFMESKKTLSENKQRGVLAIGVLFVSLLIATLAAPSLLFGISRFLNWALFIPLFFLFRNNNKALDPFLRGVLLASGVQMLGVLLQRLGLLGGVWGGQIISGIGYDPNYSQWLIRYTGFVLDANSLGMIFAIAAITSLHYSTQNSFSKISKVLFFAFSMLNLFSILLTGSRGGILITVIAVFAYLFISRKYLVIVRLVPATILVLVAGIQFAGFEFLVSSIFAIFDGTDTSANQRAELWQYALSIGDDLTIFIGQGFGARNPSLFVDQKTIFVDPTLLKFTTIDNSWLKTYLELGGMAVIALGWLFATAMRNSLAQRKSNSDFSALPVALLILFLIRSVSIDAFDINPWNSVIWIILGSMIGATRVETHKHEHTSRNEGTKL
jgi:hypothetical protein